MRDPYQEADPLDSWVWNSEPRGLEEAWTKVQVELGLLGSVAGVERLNTPDQWVAEASGPRRFVLRGFGPNPTEAMYDLEDRVRGLKAPKTRL